MPTDRKITIKNVADYLGVSKSTVSHALSGRRQISSDLVGRVHHACELLGYQPNFAATVMNSHSTGLIGLVVTDIDNMYVTRTVSAFSRHFQHHDYLTTLCLVNSLKVADGVAYLKRISNGMFDGIVNMLPQISPQDARQAVGKTPVLTYLRQDIAPLIIDYEIAARQALDYLFSLQHQRIGVVSIASRAIGETDPFAQACQDILSQAGFFSPELLFHGDGDVTSGLRAAEYFSGQSVTAILSGNDYAASGVFQWAHEHGMRLPEEWSVIGLDNTPLASALYPSLTSIDLNIEELTTHSTATLVAQIRGLPLRQEGLTIMPQLVCRRSCGQAPQIMKNRSKNKK